MTNWIGLLIHSTLGQSKKYFEDITNLRELQEQVSIQQDKLHRRNVQSADLKNKLLKMQDRCLGLEDKVKELRELNNRLNKEISQFLL